MDIEVNHRIKHNLWTLQVTGKASERKPCLDFVFSWETPIVFFSHACHKMKNIFPYTRKSKSQNKLALSTATNILI